MFNLISKIVPRLRHSIRTSATHELHFLQFTSLSIDVEKPISENGNQHPFAVDYLINKCGLSPEQALSSSKYMTFEKPNKPDAVVSFLKNQGFSETQVLKMIKCYPRVIVCNPEKTFLPKIEFFLSQGFQRADLPPMLASAPTVLTSSLRKTIIPAFSFYMNLLGSVEVTRMAIKRKPSVLNCLRCYVAPNIEILRKLRVPEGKIAFYFRTYPQMFIKRSAKFRGFVEEVRKMGFEPLRWNFVEGIQVISSLSRLTWAEKLEVYRRWGCSEDEVLTAFMKNPKCMAVSKDKIEGVMGFLVNEMGVAPSRLMQDPIIVSMSLNRRIIPRCSVYRVLVSKGLIEEDTSICYLLKLSAKLFLKRFVEKYEKEALGLLKAFEEKLNEA